MNRTDSIAEADRLDTLMHEADDRAATDQEHVDQVAERGSVMPWLVSDEDAERLLRRKVRELVAEAWKDAA